MFLRWWYRAAYWVRRCSRRPIESFDLPAGDSRIVERKILVARCVLDLVEDLSVYPPGIAADILRGAAAFLADAPDWSALLPVDRQVPADAGRRAQSPAMKVWWGLVMLGACAALLAAVTVSRADEARVDTYDVHSRRSGYVAVDTRTGRIDLYDAGSRRIGWGRIAPGARGEPTWRTYRLDGRPTNPAALTGIRKGRR